MDAIIAKIVDKHLKHRNPADLQCREQLIAELRDVFEDILWYES